MEDSLILVCDNENDFMNNQEMFINDIEHYQIPIFIQNRRDILSKSREIDCVYNSKRIPKKLDIGLDFSKGYGSSFLMNYKRALANIWYDIDNDYLNLLKNYKDKTLLIMSLYEDFTQENLEEILYISERNNINLYFLIARDMESLIWLIAKQFMRADQNKQNALFTHKYLSKKSLNCLKEDNENWEIFDTRDYENRNIKNIFNNSIWSNLIVHGHGKEDHINIGDYTLCGNNKCLQSNGLAMPRCGYDNICFKSQRNLIFANEIKCITMILASCNNMPFSCSSFYNPKYNLALSAVDGFAQKIIASLSVQWIELLDLRLIMNKENDIAKTINKSLQDIQLGTYMIEIGIPSNEYTYDNLNIDEYRIDKATVDIITRAQIYYISSFLDEDHFLKRRLKKPITYFNDIMKRGNNGYTKEQFLNTQNQIMNKISPINEQIANAIITNPNDQILDFEEYCIERSRIQNDTRIDKICSCGKKTMEYKYVGNVANVFELLVEFCYRCGDRMTRMSGCPEIKIYFEKIVKSGESCKLTCTIIPEINGEFYVGVYFPSFLDSYIKKKPSLKRYKNKSPINLNFETEIIFSSEVPKQNYYLTVFAVQNLGVSIARWYFNII